MRKSCAVFAQQGKEIFLLFVFTPVVAPSLKTTSPGELKQEGYILVIGERREKEAGLTESDARGDDHLLREPASGDSVMTYLAHRAHAQLGALWASSVGWTLTAVALGLIQWRVWQVEDSEVSSGVAWVGIWRACFDSHTDVTPGLRGMHCAYIDPTEAFAPPEIVAGQVLMLLSVLVGLGGNAGGAYSMRNVYFGVDKGAAWFVATGALCLLAAVMSLVPLLWNLTSVVTNRTINFPPDFKLPPAPVSQYVGCGIGVGLVGAALMFISGLIFCKYKAPTKPQHCSQNSVGPVRRSMPAGVFTILKGKDNPAFESHERL